MIYIGIDMSSKSFMVHAINEKREVVFNEEIEPTRGGLKQMIAGLGKQTKLVVFEAGNQLKWVALVLLKIPGVHIHVVHPNEIKCLIKAAPRRIKLMQKSWLNWPGETCCPAKFI